MYEQIKEFIKQYKKNKSAVLGFFIVLILLFMATFAPLISTHLPTVQNLADRLCLLCGKKVELALIY